MERGYPGLPKAGDSIAPLLVEVTGTMVIGAALASRDWAPQHHDHHWAKSSGLDTVIMNTPTQLGLITRYLTERLGWTTRLLRVGLRMKRPITPGCTLCYSAAVDTIKEVPGLGHLLALDVTVAHEERSLSQARVLAALPVPGNEHAVWKAGLHAWLGDQHV